MYVITGLSCGVVLLLFTSLLATTRGHAPTAQALSWIACIGSAATLGVGALGYLRGVQLVHFVLAHADPDSLSTLLRVIAAQSDSNLEYGAAATLPRERGKATFMGLKPYYWSRG